jgi:hypothetical protein
MCVCVCSYIQTYTCTNACTQAVGAQMRRASRCRTEARKKSFSYISTCIHTWTHVHRQLVHRWRRASRCRREARKKSFSYISTCIHTWTHAHKQLVHRRSRAVSGGGSMLIHINMHTYMHACTQAVGAPKITCSQWWRKLGRKPFRCTGHSCWSCCVILWNRCVCIYIYIYIYSCVILKNSHIRMWHYEPVIYIHVYVCMYVCI